MIAAAARGNEMLLPPRYPAPWEFHGLLTHGQAVLVRPIRPADADLLVNFHANLTPDTANWRHFGIHPTITPGEAAHRAEVDYGSRMAFVALVADEIVAIGSYERLGPANPAAGVSFTVADEYQRHGIATLLFESLAAYARTKAIECFVAEVMVENTDMLEVFGATGLRSTTFQENDTIRVQINLAPTPEYRACCEEREATAEVASIASVLRPRSIAVVGAML